MAFQFLITNWKYVVCFYSYNNNEIFYLKQVFSSFQKCSKSHLFVNMITHKACESQEIKLITEIITVRFLFETVFLGYTPFSQKRP